MRLAHDSSLDVLESSSVCKIPVETVSVGNPPQPFPIKGALAYDIPSNSIYFADGSAWMPVGDGGIDGITVQEEGVNVGTPAGITTVNFTGTGATATGAGPLATVTIPGLTVRDENVQIGNPITSINFVGNGVVATAVGPLATVTIPGGITVQVDPPNFGISTLNFLGAGVTVTALPPLATITIPGGLTAYGYAVNSSDAIIGADTDVIFNLGGAIFPNAGITVPAPGGTTFTILSTGVYEFDFIVIGTHVPSTTIPLQMTLHVNGAVPANPSAYAFSSNTQGAIMPEEARDVQICHGHGLINLAIGNLVTLHNITNASTETVTVTALGGGVGDPRANATLKLTKIA